MTVTVIQLQRSNGIWYDIGAYPTRTEAIQHASALRSLMEIGATAKADLRLVTQSSE